MHFSSETSAAFLTVMVPVLGPPCAVAVNKSLGSGLALTWAKVLWLSGLKWAGVTLREICQWQKVVPLSSSHTCDYNKTIWAVAKNHIIGSPNKNKYVFPPAAYKLTVSSCLSSPHSMAGSSSSRVRLPNFCRWWPEATADADTSAWLPIIKSVPSFHHLFPLLHADMVENTDQIWVPPRATSHSLSESQITIYKKMWWLLRW